MSPRNLIRASLVVCACMLGARCNDAPPAGPVAPNVPVVPRPFANGFPGGLFTIVSGADQQPIAGALLTIAGSTYITDGGGKLVGVEGLLPRDTEFVIDAAGYLPRRSMFNHAAKITLWPVSGPAEADTIRRMVYARDDSQTEETTGLPSRNLNLRIDSRLPAAQLAVWTGPLHELERALGILIVIVGDTYDDEYPHISVKLDDGNAPCRPVAAWGFCRERTPGAHVYWLQPDRAADGDSIRRVVTSLFLGANPDPGFMNATAPAPAFSALELQTIRMLLQRPRGNRWPDSDR